MNIQGQPRIEKGLIGILLYRYKQYLIPLVIIVVCFFIFLEVILPQFSEWRLAVDEESKIQDRITILENNLKFLSSIDNSNLNSNLQVASSAFPIEKDFVSILNAITLATGRSGVKIGDFIFQVGELSPKPVKSALIPSLAIALSVNEGINGTERFLSELSNSLPVSEVTDLQIAGANSNISILFYYRPLPLVKYSYSTPINSISPKNQSTLDTITSWLNNSSREIASPSALP